MVLPQAAESFMERAQNKHGFGLLAVSLGYFETLMSLSGTSTSSELTEEEQKTAGVHNAKACQKVKGQYQKAQCEPRGSKVFVSL